MNALALAAVLLAAGPAAAEAPRFELSMADAEAAARAHALDVKAAAEDSASAGASADAAFAPLLPRLTLDGSYRYQTEVPELAIVPGKPPQEFGSNRAESIGPTLTWTLWDEGALRKTWRAQQAAARSRDEQLRLVQTQATQAARLAYVQVQLGRERVRLLADSVLVASAQYADIEKRRRAGAASRIDSLSSHQTELQRRKDFLSAQSDLAAALRELLRLTALGSGLDAARPIDVRVSTVPAGLPEPTIRLALDSLADTPSALAAAESEAGAGDSHPAALVYARQADAARLTAGAAAAGEWPKVQVSGSIYYEYPNGPVNEYVTQKSAGVSASLPLFEGRQTARQAESASRAAAAADRRRELVVEQLARDRDDALAALAALRDQAGLDATAVVEAEELSRLIYDSYLAGRSTYLEVQSYQLTALQLNVNAAQTRAQILIQLAELAQLGARG
ncbi:MAG TPA: TolC family protein [Elusimicrobiota bacterium]|nr:TolC family protein [Elusimicrobiota bacterium]